MYLSGHLEIVREVLAAHFGGRYFADRAFAGLPGVTEANLMLGLRYVDAPCGKYVVDPATGRIRFTSRKLCGVGDLWGMLRERRLGDSKLFQYHKGYFAHLHAMSTDPGNTVRKIQGKILASVLGYCWLAMYDDGAFDERPRLAPNAMWIGMALHTLTDSYSPAHTVRDPAARTDAVDARAAMTRAERTRLRVHAAVKALAKGKAAVTHRTQEAFAAALYARLAPNASDVGFARRREKQLWRTYKIMEFEYETNRVVRGRLGAAADSVARAAARASSGPERAGDIVAFQHYGIQPLLTHQRLDLLHYARRRADLYARMKDECAELLRLFRDAVRTRDAARFLRHALQFLVDRPFRVHRKYLGRRTNVVLAA